MTQNMKKSKCFYKDCTWKCTSCIHLYTEDIDKARLTVSTPAHSCSFPWTHHEVFGPYMAFACGHPTLKVYLYITRFSFHPLLIGVAIVKKEFFEKYAVNLIGCKYSHGNTTLSSYVILNYECSSWNSLPSSRYSSWFKRQFVVACSKLPVLYMAMHIGMRGQVQKVMV